MKPSLLNPFLRPILGDSVREAPFLSYFNDYLTVERFASDRQLTVEEANVVIEQGRAANLRLSSHYYVAPALSLTDKLLAVGIESEMLSTLVELECRDMAVGINEAGMQRQLSFLLSRGWTEDSVMEQAKSYHFLRAIHCAGMQPPRL